MLYHFDVMPDRRATESAKWKIYPADVLPLWVADMDVVSPEPVVRALQERVAHGVFGYPVEPPDLRDLLVARMAERYGWSIQPDEIVFLPGVIVGFHLACHTLKQNGSALLCQPPVYPPILHAAATTGMIAQEAALVQRADGTFEIDFDAFEAAITAETRVFLLCSPHNPVGRVFRREELARLAEICLRHGVAIVSDEIHCDLVFPEHPHIPIASLSPEVSQQAITLMAPSKTFNIAGLECAFAIIQNAELRRAYRHGTQGLVSGVNLLGWTAALAAYRDGQDWLTQVMAYFRENRDFLVDFVNRELPGVQTTTPEGTYLAWLDCRATGLSDPYQFFLERARVAMNDGKSFGRGGEGFTRINFGCPRSVLEDGLNRMKAALLSPER